MPQTHHPRLLRSARRLCVPAMLCIAACLLAASAARGASSTVVVSQIYAGGGNAGATYANDYVELLNRGSSAVDLTGWSLQYAPAAGTNWQVVDLAGSIKSGRRFLVQLASAAAVGAALPTPDATGTVNLAAAGGKVALVSTTTALDCGASAGSCATVSSIQDLVGYGAAADYEGGAPAPSLGATTALVRAGGGCADTDANAADFAAAPPSPQASTAAATACATAPTGAGAKAGVAVAVDVEPSLSVALEHPSLSFANAVPGTTPAPLSDRVTVVSNDAAGYTLTVQRTAFTPDDLPLGISATAPAGGKLGTGLGGTAPAAIPVAPAASLVVGTASAATAAAGDVWAAGIGFSAALPAVKAGAHTATVTFTVIGR